MVNVNRIRRLRIMLRHLISLSVEIRPLLRNAEERKELGKLIIKYGEIRL